MSIFSRLSTFEQKAALYTAIVAVMLAVASIQGQNEQDNALLSSNAATNQWSYYEAKSVKQNIYESNLLLGEQLLGKSGRNVVNELRTEIERYEREKKEIYDKAKTIEARSERAQERADQLDIAEGLLQITIVLLSISAILTSHRLLYFGILVAGVGLLVGIFTYF